MAKTALSILLLALAILTTATLALADPGHGSKHDRNDRFDQPSCSRVDAYYDRLGDRLQQYFDRRGDRIEAWYDQRATWAWQNGNRQLARQLAAKGDRIDARLDRRGDRIENRYDRKGEGRCGCETHRHQGDHRDQRPWRGGHDGRGPHHDGRR